MTTHLITRLEEAADMQCPKCNARSGDDWEQCKGSCPMPGSPHFESQPQGQAMSAEELLPCPFCGGAGYVPGDQGHEKCGECDGTGNTEGVKP